MAHNRKLVLGAVDLVGSKIRNSIVAMSEARDSLESILISSSYFENAPFEWVDLIIRYGKKMMLSQHLIESIRGMEIYR